MADGPGRVDSLGIYGDTVMDKNLRWRCGVNLYLVTSLMTYYMRIWNFDLFGGYKQNHEQKQCVG